MTVRPRVLTKIRRCLSFMNVDLAATYSVRQRDGAFWKPTAYRKGQDRPVNLHGLLVLRCSGGTAMAGRASARVVTIMPGRSWADLEGNLT